MPELSVIIPCCNEERNIGECIESVRWADEILVVDSFSTDRTVEIARSLGAQVLQHEYESPGAQKNRALGHAKHSWVLFLDADERVTEGLEQEIREVIARDEPREGYWIRRRNYFLGKQIRFSGWQRDRVLRLFRRERGRWDERRVHESVVLDGRAGKLRCPLLHYSYRSAHDFLVKIERYGDWGSADLVAGGKTAGVRGLFFRPLFRFFYSYFVRGGFLDGKHGLVLCMFQAFGVFYKYARLFETWLRQEDRAALKPSSGGRK